MDINTFNSGRIYLYILRLFQILLLTYLLVPDRTHALELYSLVQKGCKAETGLIVYTDDKSVHMLNVEGKLSILKRKDIELILVYNTHYNPIKTFDLEWGLKSYLKEVYVDDNENNHFIGWPIRFIEKLIMFYDIDGKTHLIDLEKIKKFREAPKEKFLKNETSNFQGVDFRFGENLPECKSQKFTSKKYVNPTRMISDRIRIHKFFTVYSTGFMHLKRFQRKTQFYAKSFLYDEETRLGFFFWPSYRNINKYKNEIKLDFIPAYLKWSSGSHYGSQGEYSIGSTPVELLPTVEPQLSVQADVKSHFLTGTFIGNPLALSAGKDFLIEYSPLYSSFYEAANKNQHGIYTQFNYLALIGVGYDKYSVSGGFYYPVFGIFANNVFREIRSTKLSPMIRLTRTTKDLDIRLIYSRTHLKSNSNSDDGIGLVLAENILDPFSDNGLREHLDMYDLKTEYVRLNINYDIAEDVDLGFSEVVFRGKYREHFFNEDYKLNTLHFTTAVSVRQSFGDYTAVKAEVNHFVKTSDFKSGVSTGEPYENKTSLFISLEFFL